MPCNLQSYLCFHMLYCWFNILYCYREQTIREIMYNTSEIYMWIQKTLYFYFIISLCVELEFRGQT